MACPARTRRSALLPRLSPGSPSPPVSAVGHSPSRKLTAHVPSARKCYARWSDCEIEFPRRAAWRSCRETKLTLEFGKGRGVHQYLCRRFLIDVFRNWYELILLPANVPPSGKKTRFNRRAASLIDSKPDTVSSIASFFIIRPYATRFLLSSTIVFLRGQMCQNLTLFDEKRVKAIPVFQKRFSALFGK